MALFGKHQLKLNYWISETEKQKQKQLRNDNNTIYEIYETITESSKLKNQFH